MNRKITTVSFRGGCFLLVMTLLLFTGFKCLGQVDSSRVIRVLSYNILHGETTKGDFDLDMIASVILSTRPDLVALQEVDFKTRRAHGMDLATELGYRTGLAPVFGPAMPYDGGEYGEGILSRFSFLNTRNYPLHAQPGKEPRAALEAVVQLEGGDTVRFIGTHFDHVEDDTDRLSQAQQVNDIFTINRVPSILAGDLNAIPESRTMELLYREWTRSFLVPEPTFPSDKPSIKIDYILFRPKNRWRVLETQVIADPLASDHCAVLSVLELLPSE